MRIVIEGWDPVDRQPVRGELDGLDRAQTQAADMVTVKVSSSGGTDAGSSSAGVQSEPGALSIVIKQNPSLLDRSKAG